MNAIEALQLALSNPGTKVRPKGIEGWYILKNGRLFWLIDAENVTTNEDFVMQMEYDGLSTEEIINPDGTPVQWEEAE